MSLKLADINDLDEVFRMACAFFKASPYSGRNFNKERILDGLTNLLVSPRERSLCLLAMDGSKPVGMLIASAQETPFGGTVASEMAWWVDEDKRKSRHGLNLLQAYEFWARKVGCSLLQMSCLEDGLLGSVHKLLERKGYVPVERSYLKEL